MNIIKLGAGEYVINHGHYKGLPCVFIEKSPKAGEVGEDATDSGLRPDKLSDDATIIQFATVTSAMVLNDEVIESLK